MKSERAGVGDGPSVVCFSHCSTVKNGRGDKNVEGCRLVFTSQLPPEVLVPLWLFTREGDGNTGCWVRAARGVRAAVHALMETSLYLDPVFLLVLKIVHDAFQRKKKIYHEIGYGLIYGGLMGKKIHWINFVSVCTRKVHFRDCEGWESHCWRFMVLHEKSACLSISGKLDVQACSFQIITEAILPPSSFLRWCFVFLMYVFSLIHSSFTAMALSNHSE